MKIKIEIFMETTKGVKTEINDGTKSGGKVYRAELQVRTGDK